MKSFVLICVVWIIWSIAIILEIYGYALIGTILFFLGLYYYFGLIHFRGKRLKDILPLLISKNNKIFYKLHLSIWVGTLLLGIPIQLILFHINKLMEFDKIIHHPELWIIYYFISLCYFPYFMKKLSVFIQRIKRPIKWNK